MHPIILALGILIGAMFGLVNGIVAQGNSRTRSRGATICWGFGSGAITSIAITAELYVLPVEIGFRSIYQALGFAGVMFTLSMLFVPFAVCGGTKFAINQVQQAQLSAIAALANYDKLCEADGNITVESLSQALRNVEMDDETRKAISYLRDNINDAGHKVADERSFAVRVDTRVDSSEQLTPVFAISRGDLEKWSTRVADRKQSWLPRNALPL